MIASHDSWPRVLGGGFLYWAVLRLPYLDHRLLRLMACSTAPSPALQLQLGGQRKAIYPPACLAGDGHFRASPDTPREETSLCQLISGAHLPPLSHTRGETDPQHPLPEARNTPAPWKGPEGSSPSPVPASSPLVWSSGGERVCAMVGRQPGCLCCPRGPCSPLGHPGRSTSLLHSRGLHSATILGKCAKVTTV